MHFSRLKMILILGDGVVLSLVTLYGLLTHNMLSSPTNGFMRTFIPWFAAWIAIGALANLFPENVKRVTTITIRSFLAMILISPFAGFIREFFFGQDMVTIFVVVFGGISAIMMAAWRALYFGVVFRRLSNG